MANVAIAVPTIAPEERARALLSRIHTVANEKACDEIVDDLLLRKKPTSLGFINAHAVNLVWNDAATYDDFAKLDMVLRDGSGARIWMRSLGLAEGLNLNGTDLIPRILDRIGTRRLAIFGTSDPYLLAVVERLRKEGKSVVASLNGFRTPEEYARLVADTQPEVVVLAMGMPKQERVAEAIKRVATGPCLVVCGGAIVDFLAGRFSRAPLWMRRAGVEWVYRLVLEPKRLFRRYVIGVPVSMYRLGRVKRLLPFKSQSTQ